MKKLETQFTNSQLYSIKELNSYVYIGRYNALVYKVFKVDKNNKEELVFRAGNTCADISTRVDIDKGIGLLQMNQYCLDSTVHLAEGKGIFGGVSFDAKLRWKNE